MKKSIHVKIKPSLEQFCSEKRKELKAAAEALQMDVTFKYAGRILNLDETFKRPVLSWRQSQNTAGASGICAALH